MTITSSLSGQNCPGGETVSFEYHPEGIDDPEKIAMEALLGLCGNSSNDNPILSPDLLSLVKNNINNLDSNLNEETIVHEILHKNNDEIYSSINEKNNPAHCLLNKHDEELQVCFDEENNIASSSNKCDENIKVLVEIDPCVEKRFSIFNHLFTNKDLSDLTGINFDLLKCLRECVEC